MKKDAFSLSRGNWSRILLVSCAKCNEPLLTYQKDGKGELKRLYLDRIVSGKPGKKLICTVCKRELGVIGVYDVEKRKCINLFQGAVAKKVIKANSLESYDFNKPAAKENIEKEFVIPYIQIAIQYYLAGRVAFLNNLSPVSGNLFHHGIEMLLKSHLKQKYPIQSLWGHSLVPLWNLFINQYGLTPDEKLTSSVDKLDKLEEIRYPRNILHSVSSIENLENLTGLPEQLQKWAARHPHYIIELDSIDELFSYIFDTFPYMTEFLIEELKNHNSIDLYQKKNNYPLFSC